MSNNKMIIMNERKKYKYITIFKIVTFLLLVGFNSFSATIKIPGVYANLNDCISIDVEIITSDEEITTAVIAFTFDPQKIQIGCNTENIVTSLSEPIIYDYSNISPNETKNTEPPINITDELKNNNIKYRIAIYPEGLFVIALWGSTQKIPSGTIFSVPCKILSPAKPGETLLLILPTQQTPITLERVFPDNHVEQQLFYCSLSNIEALPIEVTTIPGAICVVPLNEGTLKIEGENIQEGANQEGTHECTPEGQYPEGNTNDGAIEGDGEGTNTEGSIIEGRKEEGSKEGDNSHTVKVLCGCQKSETNKNIKTKLSLYPLNINFGIMLTLLVLLRKI